GQSHRASRTHPETGLTDMARRISLREFQANLAERLAESASGEIRSLLALETPTENWLVDLADTGEVLPTPAITPVPMTRPWYRGLINVRGNLYGVVDFSLFQSGEPVALSGTTRILLVNPRHGNGIGLLFARSSGLHSEDEFSTAPGAQDARPWVSQALVDSSARRWLRLDLASLANNPEFLQAGLLKA